MGLDLQGGFLPITRGCGARGLKNDRFNLRCFE